MFCENCGAKVEDNWRFCEICGTPVARAVKTEPFAAEVKRPDENEAERNIVLPVEEPEDVEDEKPCVPKPIRAWTVSVLFIIIITTILLAAFALKQTKENNNYKESYSTYSSNPTASGSTKSESAASKPSATDVPKSSRSKTSGSAAVSTRVDPYDPQLTYKRMDGIHNSSLVSDSVFYDLEALIIDFDNACEEYINNGSGMIFDYLESGSNAYSQQTGYKAKHPNLTQFYQVINVVNARQGDGYYFVWVNETLDVTENGSEKVTNDHWVYKITKSGGKYLINDYTRDPAY